MLNQRGGLRAGGAARETLDGFEQAGLLEGQDAPRVGDAFDAAALEQ